MTALWSWFAKAAISLPARVIVGDCSGRYPRGSCGERADVVIPVLNYEHGQKIDLFMKRVCQTEYVFISDDDVLNETPLDWAIEQLKGNPGAAVVSLRPRAWSALKAITPQPMGSYCLVVRRNIWMAEGLSFRADCSPFSQGYDWYYDTADLANVELLRRGYDVIIAPPDIRAHLTAFEGISRWTLKMRELQGNILEHVRNVPARQGNALAAVLVARALSQLIADNFPDDPNPHLIAPPLLDRAEEICKSLLGKDEIEKVTESVEQSIQRIRSRLAEICAQV